MWTALSNSFLGNGDGNNVNGRNWMVSGEKCSFDRMAAPATNSLINRIMGKHQRIFCTYRWIVHNPSHFQLDLRKQFLRVLWNVMVTFWIPWGSSKFYRKIRSTWNTIEIMQKLKLHCSLRYSRNHSLVMIHISEWISTRTWNILSLFIIFTRDYQKWWKYW